LLLAHFGMPFAPEVGVVQASAQAPTKWAIRQTWLPPAMWISSAIFARHAIEQHVFDYDQLGIKIEFREHSRQRADFPKALGDTILCWRAMPANTEVADTPWRRMAGTRMPCVEHLRFFTLAQTR